MTEEETFDPKYEFDAPMKFSMGFMQEDQNADSWFGILS